MNKIWKVPVSLTVILVGMALGYIGGYKFGEAIGTHMFE